nr:hypothetical protein GCM10010200_057630 [Actinomadura rugatobispora]
MSVKTAVALQAVREQMRTGLTMADRTPLPPSPPPPACTCRRYRPNSFGRITFRAAGAALGRRHLTGAARSRDGPGGVMWTACDPVWQAYDAATGTVVASVVL